MRAFISADMEGITGVAVLDDVSKGTADYEDAVALMHGDVNAAIEGAVEAGADEVLVNDAHGSMANLRRADVDGRADLVRGRLKPRAMMEGLDADHDVALLIGYHARAGTAGGVLDHTVLGSDLLQLRVNGIEVGELGWNARLAAHLGVPVGLVTGDDRTVTEARDELGDVETVAVKRGIGRFAAQCRPPVDTRADIEEAAARAVERAADGTLEPSTDLEPPVRIEVDWSTTHHAGEAARAPGIELVDDRTTAVSAPAYEDAYEAAVSMIVIGSRASPE